ncbi:hypothetical protein [Bordetella petrii]|uniref:hypothetical protein n=1 Tax=Bordetella petrii TaxID=94624 RepID=UPI000490F3A6|nr:hypothetical protein [Bordetella petrii]
MVTSFFARKRASAAGRLRYAQRGFALAELALAVALTSMILVWAASRIVHEVDDAAARATGVWLLELKRGLDNMLRQHFADLAEGVAPVGQNGLPLYADPLAPRLAELKAQGHLPSGFPESGAIGGGAAIRILRDARCPEAGCRLDALAHLAEPLLAGDAAPDLMRIAAAVGATGGYGGAATATRVRGANFDFPNPPAPGMAPLAAGTLAAWAALGTAEYDLFVRMRDTRDPSLGGPLSVAGDISTGGRLRTDEYLALGGIGVAGQPCPAASAGLFSRGAGGGLLECRGGAWRTVGGAFGGLYTTNSLYGCRRPAGFNPLTGKCSCPAGYAPMLVSRDLWDEDGSNTSAYICVGSG